jgi:SP family arabinose:H+ symporter-like MFS transporter
MPPSQNEKRWSIYLVIAALVSTLGGFLFGFDNIVISGAISFIGQHFHLSDVEVGWAAGCALVGCIVGSASAGAIADLFGEKKTLLLCAFCFAASSLGIWFAASFTQFVVWRLLAGVGIGAASIISPMYIAEIAPTRLRGRLVTLYQLGIVVGILGAVFSNMLIQRLGDDGWNQVEGWRWMFFVGIVPAVLFGLAIAVAVESPRWLYKAGHVEEAGRILRLMDLPENAAREMQEIGIALSLEEGGFREFFTVFRKPLLIGIMLAAFQQISGITPIFSFLPKIFSAAGTATGDAFHQAVSVSLVNLLFTLPALWLVDRAGRKTLILLGTAIQFVALVFTGFFFLGQHSGLPVLLAIMAFVAGHAFGNGVACWVIISEIYPAKMRGRAMSVATTMLWITGYLGNQMFPVMMRHEGPAGTFWTFAGGALLTIVCVYWLVPETRGRSLEQITQLWVTDSAPAESHAKT